VRSIIIKQQFRRHLQTPIPATLYVDKSPGNYPLAGTLALQ
jgi:hypothetical protein